jgi:hypothetical protein
VFFIPLFFEVIRALSERGLRGVSAELPAPAGAGAVPAADEER